MIAVYSIFLDRKVKSHHPRAFMEQPLSSVKAFDDSHSPHPIRRFFSSHNLSFILCLGFVAISYFVIFSFLEMVEIPNLGKCPQKTHTHVKNKLSKNMKISNFGKININNK
jgi:hypothetical protein